MLAGAQETERHSNLCLEKSSFLECGVSAKLPATASANSGPPRLVFVFVAIMDEDDLYYKNQPV
jgi:hypothetical protein